MHLRHFREIGLLCALVSISSDRMGVATAVGQTAQHAQAAASISGRVADTAGNAVSGALVTLHAQGGGKPLQATSSTDGRFVFEHPGDGPYELTAQKQTVQSEAVSLAVADLKKPVVLVLKGQVASAKDDIAFSDGPSFTVAGVVDWTAVGGHGSDATLRTSEDLARNTVALNNERGAAGVDRETEGRLLKAVAGAPQSYAQNLELGEYYLKSRQYSNAVHPLQIASTVGHGRPEPEYDLALACRGVGDVPEAKLHVQRALQVADRADYHRLAGELAEQSGDPLAAVQQLEKATQIDPSEANYFAWASELLLHRAIWQAVEIFSRGTAAYPGSARLRTGWGTALFSGARYDEAARRLCEASDLKPSEVEPYLFLGKADMASPEPLPCVPERLERFLKLQPQNASAHYLLAMVLMRRDATSNAARIQALLEKAVALNPKYAEADLELGKIAAAKRQYPEAIDLYRKAIAIDPQQGEAHYRLAVAYDRTGHPEEAKREREEHEAIERAQADAVEQERRNVKQFLVVLQGQPVAK